MIAPDEPLWFRADKAGLQPGNLATHSERPLNGRLVVYATSRLEVARAFAAQRGGGSVYQIDPIDPTGVFRYDDPDYPPSSGAGCIAFDDASIVRVVEARVDMTRDAAWQLMSRHFLWPDQTRMYDDEGYPTASPQMRAAGIDASALRHLGPYCEPGAVCTAATNLCRCA
jgi:hypothetical protein